MPNQIKIDQTSDNLPGIDVGFQNEVANRVEGYSRKARRKTKTRSARRKGIKATGIQAEPPRPTHRKQRPTLTHLGSAKESLLEHMFVKSVGKPHDEKICRIRVPTLVLNQKTGTMIMYVTSLKMILT